jgi:hypothetical protein
MKTHLTLTRKDARIKLESAKGATYFMQLNGHRYARTASVSDMLRAFICDERARLRIRLEDSQHTVTIENNEEMRSGYEIQF